jgi:hypothetical protein
MQSVKNWITIVEDGDMDVTAHFPTTRVGMVVEVKDSLTIHLDKGSISVKGVGVERLVTTLLSEGQPVLKSGVAGIKSVKFSRK